MAAHPALRAVPHLGVVLLASIEGGSGCKTSGSSRRSGRERHECPPACGRGRAVQGCSAGLRTSTANGWPSPPLAAKAARHLSSAPSPPLIRCPHTAAITSPARSPAPWLADPSAQPVNTAHLSVPAAPSPPTAGEHSRSLMKTPRRPSTLRSMSVWVVGSPAVSADAKQKPQMCVL